MLGNDTFYPAHINQTRIAGTILPDQFRSALISGYHSGRSKRCFDLVFIIVLVPIVIPVTFILWFIVWCQGGSGLFGHQRIGQNGQSFICWKIRSMHPDADDQLAQWLAKSPSAQKEWQRNFKLNNDPRITKFGTILRKTGMDELPQLWNVLKGEMSLVGPRPITAEELQKYGQNSWLYSASRPRANA